MFNVEFEDIQFLRATAIQPNADVELKVVIHYGNGSFEVSEGSNSIMTGVVRQVDDVNAHLTPLPPVENSNFPMLSQEDFYKEMRLRGYHYKDEFQSVTEVRSDGLTSKIRWNNNWVSFMDCVLQTLIISKETRSLILPTRTQKIRIFPKKHLQQSRELQEKQQLFQLTYNKELEIVQAGGIEIVGLVTSSVSRRKAQGKLVLESYQFFQHISKLVLLQQEAYRICIQLLIENNPNVINFKVLEVDLSSDTELMVTHLEDVFAEIPLVTTNLSLITDRVVEIPNVSVGNSSISSYHNCHLVILSGDVVENSILDSCLGSLVNQGFVIARKPLRLQTKEWLSHDLDVIAEIPTETETIVLLRKRHTTTSNRLVIDISNSKTLDWIDKVKESVKTTSLILVSQHNQFNGIIGLVNCIRREPDLNNVSCVFIDDNNAPPFDLAHPLYANQLSLNLAINIYRHVSAK